MDSISTDPGFPGRQSIRTLFLSDLHLGCRHAQFGPLLEFLRQHLPREVYLVGDIFDGWELKRRRGWPAECSQVLERFAAWARHGVRICYSPGNHDQFMRLPFIPALLKATGSALQVADEFIHLTQSGRRLLILHGDRFDPIENRAQWVSKVSARVHNLLLGTNRLVSRIRRRHGNSPHAWCGRIKRKVKHRLCVKAQIWERLESYARQRDCDGVLFGHIHSPTLALRDGFLRANTGDWVEHCTAIAELEDGSLQLIPYYAADVAPALITAEQLRTERPEFPARRWLPWRDEAAADFPALQPSSGTGDLAQAADAPADAEATVLAATRVERLAQEIILGLAAASPAATSPAAEADSEESLFG